MVLMPLMRAILSCLLRVRGGRWRQGGGQHSGERAGERAASGGRRARGRAAAPLLGPPAASWPAGSLPRRPGGPLLAWNNEGVVGWSGAVGLEGQAGATRRGLLWTLAGVEACEGQRGNAVGRRGEPHLGQLPAACRACCPACSAPSRSLRWRSVGHCHASGGMHGMCYAWQQTGRRRTGTVQRRSTTAAQPLALRAHRSALEFVTTETFGSV